MERSLTPHPLFALRAPARLGAPPFDDDPAAPHRPGAGRGRGVWRGAAVGVALALVAGGASAEAATRYVATTGSDLVNSCTSQATPCRSVQRALNQAAAGETVQVAAGEYVADEPYTPKLVHLQGAGAGRAGEPFDPAVHTLLRGTDGAALALDGGGSVANMRLRGGGTAEGAKAALSAFAGGTSQQALTLIGVHATCGQATTAGNPGGRALHVGTADDARLTLTVANSTLRCETGTNGRPIDVLPSVATTVTSSDLAGVHGAFVHEGGSLTVEDTTVRARLLGLVNGDGTLLVRRSRIAARIAGVYTTSDDQDAPATSDLHDSLVHVTTSPESGNEPTAAVLLRGDHPDARVGVHGSTLALDGTGQQTGGVVVSGTNDTAQAVALTDTAVHAPTGPDLAVLGGPATITAARSAFADSVALSAAGSVPQPTLTTAAGFRAAATGDFALTPGSPLLDTGGPAGPADRDAAGAPRAQDGNGDGIATRDIGAFECATCAPAPAPAPAPVSSIVGPGTPGGTSPAPPITRKLDLLPPRLTKLSFVKHTFTAGKSTILTWHLSEAATVEIQVARKTRGAKRRRTGRCEIGKTHGTRCWRYVGKGALTTQARKGDTRMRFTGKVAGKQLPPGAYRARVTPVDAAGNRGTRSTLTFAIRPAAS